ncbi:hypothetical protein [Neisseria bacilliformis]|uniref:hypothetical protein n=1 Tax=Neisseria bacilliformis TaxID=267212 RepID=UPI0028E7FFD5|nr:hypothetical protein [Neisseria bacilliformis]
MMLISDSGNKPLFKTNQDSRLRGNDDDLTIFCFILGSVDNQPCGGVFGKKYPPAASKMPAGVQPCCAFFLAFGIFSQKTVSQAECQQTLVLQKFQNMKGRLKTAKYGFQTAFMLLRRFISSGCL